MDAAMIQELMTGRGPRKTAQDKPKRFAYAIDEDGKLVKHTDSENDGNPAIKMSKVGSFTGKAGSIRRSSKGRTYRLANGTRRFQHEAVEYVAYKV